MKQPVAIDIVDGREMWASLSQKLAQQAKLIGYLQICLIIFTGFANF